MSVTKSELEKTFEHLFSIKSFNGLSNDKALKHLAFLIDISFDLAKLEGLEKAIGLSDELLRKSLKTEQRAFLHYCLANAWDDIRQIKNLEEAKKSWDWNQIEFEKQLFHLRSAISEDGFEKLEPGLRCSIFTNLANYLDTVGRFVDAIEYWDKALDINPDFGMALGNKSRGLEIYSSSVYDSGHRGMLLKHSYEVLSKAMNPPAESYIHPQAKESFKQRKAWFEETLPNEFIQHEHELEKYPLGDTVEEQAYRKWVLRHRLFLNPLNDLGPFSIAGQDVITTPDIVTDLDVGPRYQGFYNQIKQEFVSARYLYYEGITSKALHFSDKDVLLYNTLDYPVYSLAIEKVKFAFRVAYSIFDKTAFFLNEYLELGVKPNKVSFRTIWYKNIRKNKDLLPNFTSKQNLPLRGLFWLSKDLFEDKLGFNNLVEPDAQNINTIRNHLEHKYVKVHKFWSPPEFEKDPIRDAMRDDLAYSISQKDFEVKTLRILKLARSAMIYLSLGIHAEEMERTSNRDPEGIIAPTFLDTWKDEWKGNILWDSESETSKKEHKTIINLISKFIRRLLPKWFKS